MTFRLLALACSLLPVVVSTAQSKTHFGFFYSYGAHFNFHSENSQPFIPSDGSGLGAFFHLDNGSKALGFRSALSWRSNDMRMKIGDNVYLYNTAKALELKLQCTLPLSEKSAIALGISPRLLLRSDVSIQYINDASQERHEAKYMLAQTEDSLNHLNSAISFSWYYSFSRHWSLALNLDQDMLPLYQKTVIFNGDGENLHLENPVAINARLTSITASLIFTVK